MPSSNTTISKTIPVHARFDQFAIENQCLMVADRPLTQIVELAGQTPFYVYDRQVLNQRVASLRQVLPASVGLHYAIKANPFAPLVQHMVPLVDGIDIASGGELTVALNAGAKPGQISFAGPGKSEAELHRAVAAEVLINVESRRELAILARASQALGLPARVALRVNPDFELKSTGMRMGGGAKPFGMDAEAIVSTLHEVVQLGLQFEGFHLYAGSQNLNANSICEAQQKSYELAMRLLAEGPAVLATQLRHLNIGGGFGVPYFPGDKPLDLAPIGDNLQQLADRLASSHPLAKLEIELGRYLVAEAGLYVCKVLDKKVSRGEVFLVTNGGLHHHLSASGNFGQVIRKNYPVVIANRIQQSLDVDTSEVVTIVGPLCTPLDLLADRMRLPKAEVGDLVAIYLSGAYGATASPQAFLGHPQVIELLL